MRRMKATMKKEKINGFYGNINNKIDEKTAKIKEKT